MLVTLAVPTVPVPLVTVQVSPAGCDCTVTAYPPPEATRRGIVKLLAPEATFKVSEPFASTMPDAASPVIVPPTVYDWPEQVITTLVTSAAGIVPVPLATLQVSPDGCASTLIA